MSRKTQNRKSVLLLDGLLSSIDGGLDPISAHQPELSARPKPTKKSNRSSILIMNDLLDSLNTEIKQFPHNIPNSPYTLNTLIETSESPVLQRSSQSVEITVHISSYTSSLPTTFSCSLSETLESILKKYNSITNHSFSLLNSANGNDLNLSKTLFESFKDAKIVYLCATEKTLVTKDFNEMLESLDLMLKDFQQ